MNQLDEIPVEAETTTDPDDAGQSTYIHAAVIDTSGRHHGANVNFQGEATDEEIAAGLVKVALAAASMHSSGAWMALQRLLAEAGVKP